MLPLGSYEFVERKSTFNSDCPLVGFACMSATGGLSCPSVSIESDPESLIHSISNFLVPIILKNGFNKTASIAHFPLS
jgi:hypothetical protein